MGPQLSEGAIQEIMSGGDVQTPVFQVLGQKKISSPNGADRYRLLLSDGINTHSSAMLATQLNSMVEDGQLENNTVVQLDKYICNTIQEGRRVMILLDVSVLATAATVAGKIGEPLPFKPGQQNAAPPPRANGGVSNGSSAPQQARPVPLQSKPAPKPNFYSQKPAAAKAATPGGAPNTPGGTPQRIHPISSLTPYQNRWCIRARVSHKSDVRTWSNSRGDGKLFSMTFVDEGGEIRATAFKDECDKYYDLIEVNKVYYVQKCSLKTANKQYSNVANDYEMTFNKETIVTPCEDDEGIPKVSFNFISINDLGSQAPDTTVDVIGVCKSAQEMGVIVSKKTAKEIKKRELELVDQSGVSIRFTLWGNDAEKFDGSKNPVMAVKGAKLGDFGGRSLSVLSTSQLVIDPDMAEAHVLRGWYDSEGKAMDFSTYKNDSQGSSAGFSSNWKTFSQVHSENLGNGDKPDYFTTKATVVFLKSQNCMYQACPSESCNKKLIDNNNGTYRCEKCSREYDNYKWRMILTVKLNDHTDEQWVTCFQESAETLLGRPADEIGSLKDSGDEAAFDNMFQDSTFKSYIFKLRTKMETYNEESRLKTICVQVNPINYEDYSKKLTEDIEKLMQK